MKGTFTLSQPHFKCKQLHVLSKCWDGPLRPNQQDTASSLLSGHPAPARERPYLDLQTPLHSASLGEVSALWDLQVGSSLCYCRTSKTGLSRIRMRLEILSKGNNEGGGRVFYILGWLECFLGHTANGFPCICSGA